MSVASLRLLLWLKLTLSWRMYRSSKLRVLSFVLFGLMLIPLVFAAVGLHWVLGFAGPLMREPIARDVLAVIFLLWILAPLLGFQVNESYDLTKLFTYPLTQGQIFLGSVVGGLIDPPVLLAAPPLFALWLSLSTNIGDGIVNFLFLTLFLLQTISTTQAITVVLIGFLRSRRFRDITMVVFPIFGLAYYVGQQALVHQFSHLGFGNFGIFTAPAWRIVDFLPPGLAAAGMEASGKGDWLGALGDAFLLILLTAASMAIAAATLRRLFLGDVVVEATRPPAERQVSRAVAAPSFLPADIAALAGKEMSYLRRDPQYKAVLVQMVYSVVVIAIPFLMSGTSSSFIPSPGGLGRFPLLTDFRLIGVAAVLVLATSPLIFNIFGAEGAAVTVLFSFPTSRRRILIAKNVAHAIMLLALNVVGLLIASAITRLWSATPLVLTAVVITLPILLAAGNLVSIRLPHRMLVRGQRWQRGGASVGGDSSGCAYAFLYLIAYMITAVAVAPVALALILPMFSSTPAFWYVISLPSSAVYSVVLYVILLGVAEGWLMSREPEIAAAVIPPD